MNRKKLYDALTSLKASASHSQFILVQTIQESINAIDVAGFLDSDGAYAIAVERHRQTEAKGYSASRDDEYVDGQLACAGAWYALPPASDEAATCAGTLWPKGWSMPDEPAYHEKMTEAEKIALRMRELEKAGAMMAAEWDRLDRKAKRL